MNTIDVENYPGLPEGVMRPDLMENFEKHAARLGRYQNSDHPKRKTFRTRAIIISTGAARRELGLKNEKRLSGLGVTWCATCDGFFSKNQDIAVIVGGDSAGRGSLPDQVRTVR